MEKEEKKGIKITGAKHGTIRQRMMSFRLDNENNEWLEQQPNKGRYINELIRADREKHAQ